MAIRTVRNGRIGSRPPATLTAGGTAWMRRSQAADSPHHSGGRDSLDRLLSQASHPPQT